MFGYVGIYPPELKVKDYSKYKSYYCGLCRTLKEQYGSIGQITLTYDMTFAVILFASLYEEECRVSEHRCLLHPINKKQILQGEVTEYAAAMNVVLAYYHLKDDWLDDKSAKGFVGTKLLKSRVKTIEYQYPRQCTIIQEKLAQLQAYERENTEVIDWVAGCFGEIMSELFVYKEDKWEESMRKVGFYLGKYIYILDAYDDIEADIKEDRYNPLKGLYEETKEQEGVFKKRCFQMLQMMISETTMEFEKLPCTQDIDILRNILYDGVWTKFAPTKASKKGTQEGKK